MKTIRVISVQINGKPKGGGVVCEATLIRWELNWNLADGGERGTHSR